MENKRHIGRPNKATTLVPDRSVQDRARVILAYHQNAQMHYGKASTYAILCGLELAAAQDQSDDHNYNLIIERVGLKERQIRLYVEIANNAKTFLTAKKVEKVVELLEASPSELEPKKLKLLTESVEELTQGRSINDLVQSWRPEKENEPSAPETPESKARNQANWKLEAEIHWAKIGREIITGIRMESWTKMGQDKIVVLAQTLEAMIRKVGPVADQINPDWRSELKD